LYLVAGYFLSVYGPVIRQAIIPFTSFIATASSLVIQLLGGQAHASGTRLAGAGIALDLRNGCNGVWATLIYVSAVLAFPSSLRSKLWGAALGVIAIFLVNLIRVVSLYFIVLYYPSAFEGAHIYVWQSVIIAAAVLLWLFWAQRVTSFGPQEAGP
jgi:exosortase H (IPTLxxWG-CTERM-specific)